MATMPSLKRIGNEWSKSVLIAVFGLDGAAKYTDVCNNTEFENMKTSLAYSDLDYCPTHPWKKDPSGNMKAFYPIKDINLFYVNRRENVELRISF